VQVVDAVSEHALVTLPSSTLSNVLGELKRIDGRDELFQSLCTPSTRSRAFEIFDGFEIGGVFKKVTLHTAMAFNQAYWWTGDVSSPIDGPHAERTGLHWMALADSGTNNSFYDLVPPSVGDAADARVSLVQSDGSAKLVVDDTAEKVPVVESGVSRGVDGTKKGAAGGVDQGGEGEMTVGGRRTDGNDVVEEAGLNVKEMTTEALIDDLIGPAGASSTDNR